MNSVEIRNQLVEALRLDLVGPDNDHAFARELLPESPRRWYLTGFLAPTDAPIAQRTDETSTDEIDSAAEPGGLDDGDAPERAAARKSILPSSMGLSILVASGVDRLEAAASWGEYVFEGEGAAEPSDRGVEGDGAVEGAGAGAPEGAEKRKRGWRRIPRDATVSVGFPPAGGKPIEVPVPDSNGIVLVVTVRPVSAAAMATGRLPAGTRSVSVFLVNKRPPDRDHAYRAFAFQTKLRLASPKPFVPRPDLRCASGGQIADDWDERVADLQYRDVFEFAVGHGVSATWRRARLRHAGFRCVRFALVYRFVGRRRNFGWAG